MNPNKFVGVCALIGGGMGCILSLSQREPNYLPVIPGVVLGSTIGLMITVFRGE